MTLYATRPAQFVDEVLHIIVEEVIRAASQEQKFVGIKFDDPHSCRQAIWVDYAASSSAYFGQAHQTYEVRLWPDFCLVFALLDMLATEAGFPQMIGYALRPRGYTNDGLSLSLMFAGEKAHPEGIAFVKKCCRRVEEIMKLVKTPFPES